MSLTIPPKFLDRIRKELESLPAVAGKVSLTLEFNCGTGGILGSLKVKKYSEDEMR